jgi:hypothetical protein
MKKALYLIMMMALGFAVPLLTAGTSLAAQITIMTGKGAWPADKVPTDLPPYPDGEVAGWGGNDEFVIQMANTSQAALQSYLENLKDLGWDISSGDFESLARKGAHTTTFTIFGNTALQITIRTAQMSSWPTDKIPEAMPQPKGCKLMDAMLDDQGNGIWLYSFICLGMNEQEAYAYMDGFLENGWEGDRSAVYGKTTWRGKSYGLSVELYEIAGGNASFSLNYSQQDE